MVKRIDSYLMKLGFTRSEFDPNLYFKVEDDNLSDEPQKWIIIWAHSAS